MRLSGTFHLNSTWRQDTIQRREVATRHQRLKIIIKASTFHHTQHNAIPTPKDHLLGVPKILLLLLTLLLL